MTTVTVGEGKGHFSMASSAELSFCYGIHGDLVYRGHEFTPFAGIDDEFAQHSVICTAPSKTFNLAGLQTSCIIVPNDGLRKQFAGTLDRHGLHLINVFGLVALQQALR